MYRPACVGAEKPNPAHFYIVINFFWGFPLPFLGGESEEKDEEEEIRQFRHGEWKISLVSTLY